MVTVAAIVIYDVVDLVEQPVGKLRVEVVSDQVREL
jgi:hypothetical protein